MNIIKGFIKMVIAFLFGISVGLNMLCLVALGIKTELDNERKKPRKTNFGYSSYYNRRN